MKDQLYRLGLLNGPSLIVRNTYRELQYDRRSPYDLEWDVYGIGYCNLGGRKAEKQSDFVAFTVLRLLTSKNWKITASALEHDDAHNFPIITHHPTKSKAFPFQLERSSPWLELSVRSPALTLQ